VTWTSVLEATDPGATGSYYADRVAEALKSTPDLVYVSTYFPAGTQIAKALTASGSSPQCLMGLANVDNGFVAKHARGGAAVRLQRRAGGHRDAVRQDVRASVPRGVPEEPRRVGLVHVRLREDSLRSDHRAKSYDFAAVERQLRATKGYRGATGTITIDRRPATAQRAVSILRVDKRKRFVIAK
jgi:ABC-type branched-subunit amino acid transport system substrate-binding protein